MRVYNATQAGDSGYFLGEVMVEHFKVKKSSQMINRKVIKSKIDCLHQNLGLTIRKT